MKTPSTPQRLIAYLTFAVTLAFGFAAQAGLPPVTSGLVGQYDAQAISGLVNGDTVNTWNDTSGAGNNAALAAGAPTYQTNVLNGNPTIQFSIGSGSYFIFPKRSDIRTVFWVVSEANTSTQHDLLGFTNTTTYDFARGSSGIIWDSTYASASVRNGTTRLGTSSLNCTAVNGTSTVLPAGWNLFDVVTTNGVSACTITHDGLLGAEWEGDIAEILIYNQALTADQVAQVEYYLSSKWLTPVTETVIPFISPLAGNYPGAGNVTITCATPGATIYYTTNGWVTTNTYSGPVSVPAGATTTVQAYSTSGGKTDSAVVSATYTTTAATSGVWNNPAGGSWTTSANWLAGTVPSGGTADFSKLTLSASRTVTLDGAQSMQSLAFADVGAAFDWSLNTGTGGPLTLTNWPNVAPTITVSNRTATLGVVLAGSQGFTKGGNGTLLFTNVNTLSGTVTNSAGTLQVGNGSGTGSLGSSASVVNNASLVYNITNSTANNVLPWMAIYNTTGSGNLTVNGGASGSLLIGGNVTQGGSITIVTPYGLTYDGLRLATATRTFTASSLSITGLVGDTGGGSSVLKLDTSAANGPITLDLQSGATGRMYPVSLNANAGTGTLTMSGTKASGGGGSWTGNNGNALSGAMNISSSFTANNLNLTNTAAGSISGNLTLNAATHNFFVNPGVTLTVSGILAQSGANAAINKVGSGTLVLSGINTYAGNTTINAGSLEIGGAGQLGSGSYAANIANNSAFLYNSTAAQTLSGIISGTGTVTKTNSGTLTLSGANTHSGNTTISAGKLVVNTGGSCSNSSVTVASGGAVFSEKVLTSGGQWVGTNMTFSSGTTTNAEFDFSAALPSTSVAPVLLLGDLINNGTLNVKIVGGVFAGTYPLIKYNGSLTVGTLGTVTLAGIGAGTLVNNTANKTIDLNVTQGNQLLWSAGTGNWDINTTANWNSQTANYVDGAFCQFDDTANGGVGPYTVTLSTNVTPGSLLVNNTTNAYTIGTRAIAGTTTLIKSGTNTLTLTGTNTFTGQTTINAGKLDISGSGWLGGGSYAGNILDNGILSFSSSATQTLSGIVSGTGSLIKTNTGTLILSGNNTYTNSTTISGGTLQVGVGGTVGSLGSGSVVDNGTLAYNKVSDGSTTVSLPSGSGISGSGNLSASAGRIQFNGNISLGGSQTYTQSGSWPNSMRMTASTVLTGSAITMTGLIGMDANNSYNLTLDTSAVNGPVNLAVSIGQTGRYYGFNAFTVNAGTGTVTMTGSPSAWNLTSMSITGGLAISSSFGPETLNLTATAASSISGNLTMSAATHTFTVNPGVTMTVSGILAQSAANAAITKNGAGTLILSGKNTYAGNTTINAGKLQGVVGGSSVSSTVVLNATTATNSVAITDNTKGWTNSALTASAAGVLEFDYGTVTPGTTVSPLKITGAAAFTATPSVRVLVASSPAGGVYPLMTWGSTSGTAPTTANLTVVGLTDASTVSLSNSAPANTLYLVVVAPPTYYWDNNGATLGFGTASGTWASPTSGNSSQGWSTNETGGTLPGDVTTDVNYPISFGNGATGLGAGTITVSGNVTNQVMTFASGSGAIVLSGGTINFPSGEIIIVNNSTDTISSVLAGTSLTKAGAGTLVLSGVNTYNGNTTITAGRLQGVVGGSSASSTVVLNGTTAINSVSITDNTKGWTNAALTVSAAGVLEFSFGAVLPSTTVSPLKITGATAFTATPTVSVLVNSGLPAGTYPLMTWGSTSGTAPTNVTVSTLVFGTGASLSVSGNTLNLVIGTAPWTVYYDNNGTTAGFGTAGGTWASPTISQWNSDSTGVATPFASITTRANDAVNFGNGATGLGAGTIMVSGNVTNAGMTFASGSGNIVLSGGTINLPAAATITVNNTNDTISSELAGAGTSLTKAGTGILTLAGVNTYAGGTLVGAGVLNVINGSALGSGSSVTVSNGSGLAIAGGITITKPLNITGTRTGAEYGAPGVFGSLLSTGTNTVTGLVTLSGGRLATVDTNTMTLTGGVTNGTASGSILVGAFAINNNPINLGTNAIQLAGDGNNPPNVTGKAIQLNAAGNTWSDALLFFAGIVRLGVDNAMPTNGTVRFGFTDVDNSRSTLDLNGHNQTVATIESYNPAVSGANVSITGGGTLTVNQSATSKVFTGIISDGATPTALTKAGTGTLTLSNACTYSGATTVSNGVLQLTRPDGLSTNTTVKLFTTAGSLDLAFTGTNQVAALYINGVAQPAGVYGASGPITGTGFLQVRVVAPLVPGNFSGISVSGTTLTLNVTGGTPNGPWTLLSSTNVALPMALWKTNSTGNYNGSGNLNLTLPNTATNTAEFFILK